MTRKVNEAMAGLFDGDEVESVLRAKFYSDDRRPAAEPVIAPAPPKKVRPKAEKPDHYEVICISMYKEDLERLDAKVKELKRSGHRKMNRSALIRFALDQVDATKLPRSY
jgi:hypothetical protein